MFGGFTDPLGVRGLGVGAETPLQSSKNIRDKSQPTGASKKKKPFKYSSANEKQKNGMEVFFCWCSMLILCIIPALYIKHFQISDVWVDSMCHELSDLESSDEYLTLPNKLGPAASPVIPKVIVKTSSILFRIVICL